MMLTAATRPDGFVDFLTTLLEVFVGTSDVERVASKMPHFAPWMIAYSLLAGLIYHLIVARGARRRRRVPAVFG